MTPNAAGCTPGHSALTRRPSGARALERAARAAPRYSLTWVTVTSETGLVGFVNVVGDGGAHAILLDTVVDPAAQGDGIGRELVRRAAAESAALGCEWLHVDYEPKLADFYERVCGFGRTVAGLRRLA